MDSFTHLDDSNGFLIFMSQSSRGDQFHTQGLVPEWGECRCGFKRNSEGTFAAVLG
jgi:hypothetical protein